MKLRLFSACVITPCLLVMLLTACSGSSKNNSSTDTPEQPSATVAGTSAVVATGGTAALVRTTPGAGAAAGSAATPAAQSIAVSQTVAAGDFDLTVDRVRTVDASQYDRSNAANVAVDLQIVNSRGSDTVHFSAALDIKLVDTQGASHDPDIFCGNCPGQLDNVSVEKGGQTKGTVYFDLQGATTKQLEYQRFTTDPKVVVALPAVQGAARAAGNNRTADPNSSDCQYAAKLTTGSLPLLSAIFGQLDLAGATPGPSGTPTLTADQANKAIASLLQGEAQTTTALKQITPPAEFKAYHAEVLKQFDTLTQQLQDAQKAAAGGDTSRVAALFSGNSALDTLSNIDTTYPELAARINACPSPLDSTPTSKP